MRSKRTAGAPAVPSRNALRLLRQLAIAGSTVGSFCTVAAITYDVYRRVRVAERIIENKRALQTSAPHYDATSSARRLARMMEAAEAGEFKGAESLKEDNRRFRQDTVDPGIHVPGEIPPGVIADGGIPRGESFLETAQLDIPPGYRPGIHMESLAKPIRYANPDTAEWARTAVRGPNTDGIDVQPSTEDPVSLSPATRQMQELLGRGHPIDAAQIFLDEHPASLNGISSERKELAVRAFFANCDEGNVFMARSIFERLEEVDVISLEMWRVLMFKLAQKGCLESTATIYERYRLKFPIPPEMVDIIMRSLLESHRLTTAKWVLYRNLHVDRDCGLCGAYLTGLWKKTGSIELLNGQLKKLLRTLPRFGKEPSDKLFNPVVKAYIEFGRFDDAEALVQDMVSVYYLPVYCRTMGLLVYAKALQCDWTGVEYGLQKMHEAKLTSRRRDFAMVFDRIFLEYWVSHSGPEIRDFVFRGVEKFNLVPDRVLYKHILEAFVEKGTTDMIAELGSLARERSWKISINEAKFLDMLRSRRLALEDGPVGFWQMLQAARMKHGQASTSRQILGYDQHSFPSPEVNKMPLTQSPLSWHQRSMEEVKPSKPVDQYQKLHKTMAHYMHSGKMMEALKCFENAKNAKFHMKQLHVELAVIATLLQHGLTAARAVIDAEWQPKQHRVRSLPVFFRRVVEVDGRDEGAQIKMAVLQFYNICLNTKKMNTKHHLTVAMSRRLISLKKSHIALDLLTAVYLSPFRDTANFDGVCLKMFVRAFAELENLDGIRWGILSALARPGTVTWDLVVEVRRALGVLRRKSSASPASGQPEQQLEYLDDMTNLLEKKSDGKLPTGPEEERLVPQSQDQSVDETSLFPEEIRETLGIWDERYELKAILQPVDTNSAAAGWTSKQKASSA